MRAAYAVAVMVVVLACRADRDPAAVQIQAMAFHDAEWSEPMNLGPVVNSSADDQNATLSRDGLSLYFASTRVGGVGGTDIWISRRACLTCAWDAPQNLAPVNSPGTDGGPGLSIDGHLLFFHSNRPGGQGLSDLWVSRRADARDDFGWELPRNLGPGINTAMIEFSPEFLESGETGSANLYFSRGVVGTLQDIFRAGVTRDGQGRGEPALVSELSDPAANDAAGTVRTDGRELLFWSNRAGGLGGADIWRAIRSSNSGPWAQPVNLGPPVNGVFDDQRPNLSADGRTLLFDSNRPEGAGGQDLWMSTRAP